MTHNPNVYGYVNGKPVFSRDEFIFEHRKRGPIEDDAELIAFAEKATSGWHNAGWSHSFISFYLSDYALSEPFASLTLSDTKLDNLGRILTGKITIKLTEYAEEASSKKASSGKSSSSGKSGSSSKSAAGIATYKELGISSSAVNVGASSSAKASKKPTNAQLK